MTSSNEWTEDNPEMANTDLSEASMTTITTADAPVARSTVLTVTWEHLLWVAVVGVGAVLRLAQLGATPLSPEESHGAMAAWSVYHGLATDMPHGPLLTYGTALVFLLFGANDATVRLLPALSGIALSGLPWLLRGQIGPWASLACGFFLATSPTLVLYSRRVDSAVLVACLAVAVIVFLLRFVRERDERWVVATALGLGALLASGPSGYTAVAGVLAVGVAQLAGIWPAKSHEHSCEPNEQGRGPGQSPSLGVTGSGRGFKSSYRYPTLAALAAVLIATGLLSNLHGIQDGLLDAAAAWAGGWAALNALDWFIALPGLLVTYEPLLTLFAVVGIVTMLGEGQSVVGGLAWWIVVTLILASPGGPQSPDAMVLPLLGLAVFASLPAARLVQRLRVRMARCDFAILALIALPLVWLVVFALGYVSRPDPLVPINAVATAPTDVLLAVAVNIYRSGWIGALLPLVCLLLALAVFTHRLGWRRTAGAAGLVGLVLLAMMSVHTALLVGRSGAEAAGMAATSSDVRTLVREVGDSRDALKVLRREGRVRVSESLRAPLAWYLRDLDVVFGDSADSRDQLVIASSDSPAPVWRHGTRRYVLLEVGSPPTGNIAERWLWYFYRELPGRPELITADLHVRF